MINSDSNCNNDMVNLYNSRLKEFDIDQMINDKRTELGQWREDCHKMIDDFYQRKLEELNNYIDVTKKKCEEKKRKVQSMITQINDQQKMNEENRNLVNSIINSIERDLNDIEKTTIQIDIRPLTIDDSYIHIEKEFSLRNFAPTAVEFYYSDESSSAIASNDRFLLMHQNLYLCLVDRDSKIVKQTFWPHGWIRDMCWSLTLNCFIVITANNIYFVNEKLEFCPPFQEDMKQVWFSCTCSDKSLYLSTCEWGSSIYELNLLLPFDLVTHWKPPLICETYEGINDIKYNNETLALMIQNPKEHKKRMDLKSAKTFDTIWSFQLSIGFNIRLFTCCLLNHNEWLVIDGTTSDIYHITKDGQLKEKIRYITVPYRANLFGSNIFAVSAENDLNLHKILI